MKFKYHPGQRSKEAPSRLRARSSTTPYYIEYLYNNNKDHGVVLEAAPIHYLLFIIQHSELCSVADTSDDDTDDLKSEYYGVAKQISDMKRDYGGAGRRSYMANNALKNFVEKEFSVYEKAYTDAKQALSDKNDKNQTATNAYGVAMSAYMTTMNSLSDSFSAFRVAEEERNIRQSVYEYASTPYLMHSSTQGTVLTDAEKKEYRGDALDEYNLAADALKLTEGNLADAAFRIETGDKIEEFYAIVQGLKAGITYIDVDKPWGTAEQMEYANLEDKLFQKNADGNLRSASEGETITQADRDRYAVLRSRYLYEKYYDLIVARADYIEKTYSLVRLNRSASIVDAEIKRREAIAAQAKADLDEALNANFSISDPDNKDQVLARNAVYRRLLNI